MRAVLYAIALIMLSPALVHAGPARVARTAKVKPKAAKAELNARQRKEVRKELRSLLRYRFEQAEGRRPTMHTIFTPIGKSRIAVEALVNWTFRGQREPLVTRDAVVTVGPGQKWRLEANDPHTGKLGRPRSAAEAVRMREGLDVRSQVVVVGRQGKLTSVLFHDPTTGDGVYLAKIDKNTHIVSKSPDLAGPIKAAAVNATYPGAKTNVHLRELSKSGRSIVADVYYNSYRTSVRVALDKKGAPAGRPVLVKRTYLDPSRSR